MNLPDDIRQLLIRLRSQIRRYLLLQGIASVIIVLGLMFWGMLVLDWGYFQISRLELPRGFRIVLTFASICILGFSLFMWVILQYFRQLRNKALVLLLERRFPELDDRLITAIEMTANDDASGSSGTTPLSGWLLQRTVADANRLAASLDVQNVFTSRPLKRALACAAIMVMSLVALGVMNQQAFARWASGYWKLEDEYWPRETQLRVRVLAQPGDRVREFQDGRVKHPRGGDLVLVVDVVESKTPPDRVQLRYRMTSGGSTRVLMTRSGEDQFKHTISGLIDDVDVWVTGGDYTNRRPYHIEIVDPPRIDNLTLHCRYPDYTGLNGNDERDNKLVLGPQIAIPMETAFDLVADTNKPLIGFSLQTDRWELSYRRNESANFTLKSPEGDIVKRIPLASAFQATMLASNARQLRVPFFMGAQSSLKLDDLYGEITDAIPLPPESNVRIELVDEDDIYSSEPARLMIQGILDEPPIIEAELRGVGTSVTRMARIPIAGLIMDDYGLMDAHFEFLVDQEQEYRTRSFRSSPAPGTLEFRLGHDSPEPWERFDVLPLDLAVGHELSVTLTAVDGDDVNGPHSSRSQIFKFKIVSQEELMSLLYAKELNLRRRFEQIHIEVQQTKADLQQHRIRAIERQQLASLAEKTDDQRKLIEEISLALSASAERGLHGARKNATESASIEEAFRDIREELINNGVNTRQILDRIDDRILSPLHVINTIDYPNVDEAIGLYRLANERSTDPVPRIDESLVAVDELLVHMESVLNEMQDLLEYHEAVELLKKIIHQQEELVEKTKSERKRSLLEGLKSKSDK
ncbi:MAG: hypothetical protein O2955_15900 [Planctomycetota bacterium]|nr:hypothetical protein [Planctomycetota bacterium]